MIEFAREGDTIFVHDFSRLARSTKDLLSIVEQLQAKGVHLRSNKEHLDSNTPQGKLMLVMLAAINEFERANMLERQREGIEIAKKNGKFKGRKTIKLDPELFKTHYARYMKREINKKELAKILNVSEPTLFRRINEYNGRSGSAGKSAIMIT